jgi:4-amino-4-deoxy-L-arabinose transferase-like glycosyltransferase
VRARFLLVALLCAVTLFAGLGRSAITDSDEAFYAEAAREMVESGNWLTPHFNYEHRFQKPILFYWLIAATFGFFGVVEWAARFWSAMAGLGMAFIAADLGARWFDRSTGLLAGIIVGTSFGCAAIARMALPDLPLAFFITLAVWAALIGLFETPGRQQRWLVLAAAALALGLITKGPLAVVLPVLVLAPIVIIQRPKLHVGPGAGIAAAAVFLLIGVPWYAAMALEHGWTYVHGFFVGDNIERFATTRFNDPRPVWFYLPVLFAGMLPWSPFFLLWIRSSVETLIGRRRPSAFEIRLAAWALMPLAFFSLSVGKQPRYILPLLPPLALLLARSLLARIRASDAGSRELLLRTLGALGGLAVVASAAVLYRATPLMLPAATANVAFGSALVALAGTLVFFISIVRVRHLPAALATASMVTLLSIQFAVLPAPEDDTVRRVAAMVAAERKDNEAVGVYQVFVRNLVHYTHVRQTGIIDGQGLIDFLERPERVLCVIPEHALVALERAHRGKTRRIAAVDYINLALIKPRTLLRPDPSTDLERVWLVDNNSSRAGTQTGNGREKK